MAAYRRVYDSRHLQADCQEPGSATEPYARQWSMGYLSIFTCRFVKVIIKTFKNSKAQLVFKGFFILSNLINKFNIKILIVICEIHQFHHFTRCSSPSLTGDLSLVRYGVPCMGCFSCALGSYFRVRSSYKKT